MSRTFKPCDECDYSFSKQNQESRMCRICELKKALQDVKTLSGMYEKLNSQEVAEYHRLTEYEKLQDKLDEHFGGHIELEMIVNAIIEYDKQFARDEKLADAMLITNDSVRKYREWKSLEEQGKLLKLPCAVGDTVYQIIFDKYTKCSAYKREFNEYYCEECEKECDSKKEYHIEKVEGCHLDWILEYWDEFYKTVFLTREEAEAALEEMGK